MQPITPDLVARLIARQFPQWKDLPVYPVACSGHDNRTYHLGDQLMVRLPSCAAYEAAVVKEITCLPRLQKQLAFPIPAPIAQGQPDREYPFSWSVLVYIPGEALRDVQVDDQLTLSRDLACFLTQLQTADASYGPKAGSHNFHRGGNLAVYDQETQQALHELSDRLPVASLHQIWTQALKSQWEREPVWVHGDVAPGNLLIKNDRLYAMIDFGTSAVGDPACDYVMAWTYFRENERAEFLGAVCQDQATLERAMGWALWKALICHDHQDPAVASQARHTIQAILAHNQIQFRPVKQPGSSNGSAAL